MFRKPGGYTIITDPEAGVVEEDSFTCKHCQRVVWVAAKCDPVELGGRCTCCDALICKHCVGKPCDHIEKKLERWEARGRLFEAMRDA